VGCVHASYSEDTSPYSIFPSAHGIDRGLDNGWWFHYASMVFVWSPSLLRHHNDDLDGGRLIICESSYFLRRLCTST